MGCADRAPNTSVMSEHHWIPRVVPILGSTDGHLAVAVLARSRCSSGARCACCRWRTGSGLVRLPVSLAAHHHGPDDASPSVRQRHLCDLLRLVRQQFREPWHSLALLAPAALFGLLDHRGGAEHQQPAQTLVTLPADFAEPLLAAGGVLARRDADPRRKVPGRAKGLRIGHPEGKADAADRPDTGDGGPALAAR